jgi:hypothetical protein
VKTPAALFPIVLALGGIILVPWPNAWAQDTQGGPIEIEKCQTISQPGSYKLVKNLTFTANTGGCLQITVSAVTIDLAGFTISGPGNGSANNFNSSTGILAMPSSPSQVLEGLAVRNGSISGFGTGVALVGSEEELGRGSSVVEGLRVFGVGLAQGGIFAIGIVKGNTVVDIGGVSGKGIGISATGIVTGNYVTNTGLSGMTIGAGSTVIGNTVTDSGGGVTPGIFVICPSNVTNNTAFNNPGGNIVLNVIPNGNGCNDTNNVAP